MKDRLEGLQVRPMTVADLDDVIAVEQRAYSHPWSHGNFVDSLAAGYRAEAWRVDGELLGYFVAMPGVDELHLLNITVAPEWQGRGIGSAMLHAVQAHCRDRAFAKLWLEVRESNLRARALYLRRGFAEVALRRGYYPALGRREDAVVMALAVTAPQEAG
jgi:ribosomal-protein-alanine N-acetyltransferase